MSCNGKVWSVAYAAGLEWWVESVHVQAGLVSFQMARLVMTSHDGAWRNVAGGAVCEWARQYKARHEWQDWRDSNRRGEV